MDPIVGHRLYSWHRWAKLADGRLECINSLSGRIRELEYRSRRERVFCVISITRYWYNGRIPVSGFFPILCFLGSNVIAHVFPDWNVGWTAKRICSD